MGEAWAKLDFCCRCDIGDDLPLPWESSCELWCVEVICRWEGVVGDIETGFCCG